MTEQEWIDFVIVDELFNYANIPSYMKSNKKSYNEKDKNEYDFSR